MESLSDEVFNFVLKMSNESFTSFSYSQSGDIYDNKTKWGLGQAVFVTKILYMLGKLKDVGNSRKKNLTEFILSFQKSNGYIYDPLISKLTMLANLKKFLHTGSFEILCNKQTKTAETRQSYAALFALNQQPQKPFLHIPYSVKGVDAYLSSLDWRFPWAAGSHFNHLVFFYKVNKSLFSYQVNNSTHLIDYAIKWVNRLQSKVDGTWHDGDVPLFQKINGAMKILVGFSVVDFHDLFFIENLIDTVLLGINDSHACDNFNIVYCLFFASKLTDYRKDEIEQFCLDRLTIYKEFYHEQKGGFSFHKHKANDVYYGSTITRGLNEPDIHGTAMFLWGIVLISNILKLTEINLQEPIT